MSEARNFPWRRLATPLLIAASAALVSCAVGPNYHRPDLDVPAAYKTPSTPEAVPPPLTANWWTLFNDPTLTKLAEETVAANFDVKAAIARVDEAHAATRSAAGGFFPAISLDPSIRRAHSVGLTSTLYSLPLELNYEVDLWGRLRRQYESFRETERASADDLVFVQQTAVTNVAQAYFAIRFYDREVAVYREALDLYRRQLDLTNTKFNAGLALQTDLLQAKTQVDIANDQLIEVRRARAKQEHAIAILLGRPPAGMTLEVQPLAAAIPTVPSGLPVDLLNRRPDVAEAEHNLAAANAQIGVAVANFFPAFSVTGSAGFDSSSAQHLLDWENRVWSIIPGLNLPIFQGGQLTAALAGARARYRELVANYHTAVLGAFRDVEDQLSDLQLLAEEATSLDATVADAQENSRLTELQYRQGLTDSLHVITANQTLLTTELSVAQTQLGRLDATVLLIKAVGGGWPGGDAPAKR
jgi:multidrug efflux system outer membrane protein